MLPGKCNCFRLHTVHTSSICPRGAREYPFLQDPQLFVIHTIVWKLLLTAISFKLLKTTLILLLFFLHKTSPYLMLQISNQFYTWPSTYLEALFKKSPALLGALYSVFSWLPNHYFQLWCFTWVSDSRIKIPVGPLQLKRPLVPQTELLLPMPPVIQTEILVFSLISLFSSPKSSNKLPISSLHSFHCGNSSFSSLFFFSFSPS